MKQRELLHLLMRGEQIAFDAIDDEGQRLAVGALPLRREALGEGGVASWKYRATSSTLAYQ